MNVKDLKKPTIHNAAKIMTLQCHFECFSTLDVKSSLRFCSYANPEKGRIDFWDLKVAARIHPASASLSCRGQAAAPAPLPHVPYNQGQLAQMKAPLPGGFSGSKVFSWSNWKGQCFGFWKSLNTKKNIRSQISPDSSVTCLFPPGSYKSGRTDFLGACIEG